MDRETQINIYREIDQSLIKISSSKSHDYATEDVLSNFKSVSGAARELKLDVTNPTNYALFMVLLKIARLTNLLNGNKKPNNESIEDSFLDAINYLKLAYCTYLDENK